MLKGRLDINNVPSMAFAIDCVPDISAQQNRRRNKEPTLLYSTLIKKKFVCEVNSFAFNGNSLHWEHDCIFALPLRLSVKHYYKQVIVFTKRHILN